MDNTVEKSKSFIKISYHAFGNSDADRGVDDFSNIDEFRINIHNHYENTIIRPIPTGRGGSAYQLFIELILPAISFSGLTSAVVGGIFYDSLKKFLQPLLKAACELDKNDFVAYKNGGKYNIAYSLSIDFDDTKLVYFPFSDESFFDHLLTIFVDLSDNYEKMRTFGYRKKDIPKLIMAPVIPKKYDRRQLNYPEHTEFIEPNGAMFNYIPESKFHQYIAACSMFSNSVILNRKSKEIREAYTHISSFY